MNIYKLLPEKMSDESAYHLVNFLMNLALELESYYFDQIRRYDNDNTLDCLGYHHNNIDDELPF